MKDDKYEEAIIKLKEAYPEFKDVNFQILASNRDKEIFFKELLNPSKPNKSLKEAAARYKKMLGK
jgi:uncharacterized protein (DUF1778 family)